jgi:hypothetical protein
MMPSTLMIKGVLTLARAQSAALISAPVRAVTTAPPAPPVAAVPNPTGVPAGGGGGGGGVSFTVIENAWLDCVPQLLVYVVVAEQDAVGLTVCSRAVPEVPQPLHDQLPSDDGSGLKLTCAPALMVALAVWVPLTNGVIVVGLQVPPAGVPPPVLPPPLVPPVPPVVPPVSPAPPELPVPPVPPVPAGPLESVDVSPPPPHAANSSSAASIDSVRPGFLTLTSQLRSHRARRL